MDDIEPTLEKIEDYNGGESKEKRLTIWIVILSVLLMGAIYGIISVSSTVPDVLADKEKTGIIKY
ncbi:hypothetical protein [Sulfurovum sp.]|uniref:hypothetical protein n=1 Tax=Sulfurovum sp. TaxID=1969726 RepID=UPI0028680402|nr:hypothetical protein [Sulfurovum sp.]